MEGAQPLSPAPPTLHESMEILKRDGVVRLDRDAFSVDENLCADLRDRILAEIETKTGEDDNGNDNGNDENDNQKLYVPGTRLRPGKGVMDLTFGGDARHDVLLPLKDDDFPQVRPVLESAVRQLQPLLSVAVEEILPHLHGTSSTYVNSSSGLYHHRRRVHDDNTLAVELVEVGSLLVRQGSLHQSVHGDYRRFTEENDDSRKEEPFNVTKAREGKLPPRMVTFVALQDIPSDEHGSTGFITGTHNSQAHGLLYRESVTIRDDKDRDQARQRILQSSTSGVRTTRGFRRGEMLIYDASVLHWGGANSIENNDRAIFYFGLSRNGSAARLSLGQTLKGFDAVPPILLQDI